MEKKSQQIARYGLSDGNGQICVLISGHEGGHRFKEVPIFEEEPLYDAFCPYCGARPALEGPGCVHCGGQP